MSRPKKYKINLQDREIKTLKSLLRKKETCKTVRSRCQILIDLDEEHGKILTHIQSSKSNDVCMSTVQSVMVAYSKGGIENVIKLKRNINSDNSRRVVDGRAEARIIELACGPVPEGHCRWTIRLLEEKSKVALDIPVGRESIRCTLKKLNLDLTKMTIGVSLQNKMLNL